MTRPTRRNSHGSKLVNDSAATSTSSTRSPPTRSSKRKAGGGGGGGSAASSPASSPRGNAKKIKVTGEPLPPPPQEAEEEEDEVQENPQDTEKRQRAIELLRSADDLPSAYAALKLVKEIGVGVVGGVGSIAKRISRLSASDQALIQHASLAVPYLMYKLCVEEFTQPRAQGGLAYSHAKAVEVATILFERAGPACCCTANITELQLVKKCSSTVGKGKDKDNSNNAIITKNDARKVLPILKKIGVEARSKLDETIAKLEASPLNESKLDNSEEEEAPQSNETKLAASEKEVQQEASQADETKVDDEEEAHSLDI